MTYVDFHTHTKDWNLYHQLKIKALVNCMTLEEVNKHLLIPKNSPFIKLSIGCHPNTPERLESLLAYYKEAHVVGEIGMDNCWTDVALDLQRKSFLRSLKKAAKESKPIIVHTKGMGTEIFKILKDYKMMKIIHWYSDDIETLKKYPLENAYYTIGPDVETNKNVQDLVDYLPFEHMLTETDGLEALEWALNKPVGKEDIKKSLDRILNYISKAKDIPKSTLMKNIEKIFDQL